MKILRINDKRAYFIRPGDWKEGQAEDAQPFKPITEIGKDDLLSIIDYLLQEEVETDPYKEDLIANPAERIVYKQIYDGLIQAAAQKSQIIADIDARFADAMKKYG